VEGLLPPSENAIAVNNNNNNNSLDFSNIAFLIATNGLWLFVVL
jgi:hypothetical protein